MSELLVWKEKLREFYAKYSLIVDKVIQFLLAIVTFYVLNRNIGVMKSMTSPIISLGLAVVCTVLPPIFTMIFAAGLVLLHMCSLSLGIMGVCAIVFFMMFALYCQFTPKRAIILMITPIACMLNLTYVVPIACGLVFGPVIAVPIVFGTITYYMIAFLKVSATTIVNTDGVMNQMMLFVKSVFQNKEMWVACFAVIACVCIVYAIRRMAIDYAWAAAVASGAIVNIVVYAIGSVSLGVKISYGALILGNLVAIVVGLVMEFLFFSVDYSRTERMQFEDDEYYYYVKAVPKLTVAAPDKVVKHINERKHPDKTTREQNEKSSGNRRMSERKKSPESRRKSEDREEKSTEEILLERNLKEEMEFQDIVNKELNDK